MEQFWIIAGDTSLGFSALVTTALVVAYAFTRFESTQVGRQFMLTKLCLALALDYAAIVTFFLYNGPRVYSSYTPARAVIYAIIGLVMLRWLIILVRAQRYARQHRHPVWDAPDDPPPVRSE